MAKSKAPARIQYVGLAGISKECQDGVLRLLQYRDEITRVRILSCGRSHCLLLTVNVGDIVAVKSGFSSGYRGEGPRTFSYVLQVLHAYEMQIDEYDVSSDVVERLDASSLTQGDLKAIDEARPVQPSRFYDYILDHDFDPSTPKALWRKFPFVIPLAVVDDRIADLAISFWQDPDGKLLRGYRRLEDIVRKRTRIDEHGAKLFSEAFNSNNGSLTWENTGESERIGRMNLFTGTFASYRNHRAHRESRHSAEKSLLEFLLLNHLYKLEMESIKVRRRKRRSAV
jgi:hypothetical protein